MTILFSDENVPKGARMTAYFLGVIDKEFEVVYTGEIMDAKTEINVLVASYLQFLYPLLRGLRLEG
jgi:hypothetical protein